MERRLRSCLNRLLVHVGRGLAFRIGVSAGQFLEGWGYLADNERGRGFG